MSAGVEIRAPAEQTEGTRSQILRWLKQVGEHVAENEPLIEIETDKVTVEVAAPASGVLREILRHEQQEIAPGELLGRLEAASAAAAAQTPLPEHPGARAAPAADASVRTPGAPATPRAESPPTLSPAVRRLLAERGLDASELSASGPGGRITVEDVLRAAPAAAPRAREPPPTGAPAPAAEVAGGGIRRIPHTVVRKRIAEHMVESLLHTAPHVTTVFEADLTAVLADRARRREELARRGTPLTLSAYFVQAAVVAIRAVPEANSRWTDTALEIHESVHIGIATAVEGFGLIVPVLRDAQSRDLPGTARALDDLVTRARSGELSPAEVRGGTFTISNHGVSGSLLAAPIIINQPQSSILGIGKLEQRATVVGEGAAQRIVVQPRCYVTLTLDHRVMDGHQANRFMQTFVQVLERWGA
ncbi:MAG TPA: dihydrolipoamide acetyltransferase family protein [Steroidobacteraceae bacterium]|jgi:2-oxoglutarate dehydrogenase E2 component (dihydrolipoamide succinyltransferase)|nr:dihydrolipoamide acetyltransferase family protein [Steroidobacteraceae bacterium]